MGCEVWIVCHRKYYTNRGINLPSIQLTSLCAELVYGRRIGNVVKLQMKNASGMLYVFLNGALDVKKMSLEYTEVLILENMM